MAEVQKNHEVFVKENGGGSNSRDEMLKALAAANDAYFELKGNLQEGTKFYNDLTQLLVTFQNKVNRHNVTLFLSMRLIFLVGTLKRFSLALNFIFGNN